MQESILILDFGSQVTQLIGRRLREMNVYCEIHPYNKIPELTPNVKGVILSGSPFSVRDEKAPFVDLSNIKGKLPLLGICYGSQFMAYHFGGDVNGSIAREYGRASLTVVDEECPLFDGVSKVNQVWMSHGDTIAHLPENARVIASTEDVVNAAYRIDGEETYAVQFHPEVSHSVEGSKMIENFAKKVCGCKGDWTPASFVDNIVEELREKLGNDKVILGLSGGVDSTVAAVLLNKAIGSNLHCIFVDNGLLRKNEFEDVLDSIANKNLALTVPPIGETFKLGEAEFEVIYTGTEKYGLNEASIILKMIFGKHTYLFTGDTTEQIEMEETYQFLEQISLDSLQSQTKLSLKSLFVR